MVKLLHALKIWGSVSFIYLYWLFPVFQLLLPLLSALCVSVLFAPLIRLIRVLPESVCAYKGPTSNQSVSAFIAFRQRDRANTRERTHTLWGSPLSGVKAGQARLQACKSWRMSDKFEGQREFVLEASEMFLREWAWNTGAQPRACL